MPTFDKLADVPKPFADLYEEHDGKWQPKADEDADDLAAELVAEKGKREAAEKLATKTAGEIKKLERAIAATKSTVPADELEKMRGEMRKEFDDEYGPKIAEAEKFAAENRSLRLDTNVQKLAAEAGFLPTKLADLWKLHGDDFDLAADGKVIVKGKPSMDPAKHVASLAKARPEWVQGTKAGGSGALGGAGTAGAPSGMTWEQLNAPGGIRAALQEANAKTTA